MVPLDNVYMDDDPEIQRIMKRKLQDMLNRPRRDPASPPLPHMEPRHIVNLSSATFDQTVSAPNPTLVDFWAEWCGPCKTMHPVFEEANASYPHITFARVNVDASPDVAARFSIQSIPTFVMFKSGRVVDTVMGAVGSQGIHAMCQRQA